MNRSSNAETGALQFHLKVSKGEDGSFTASVPSQPAITPGTGPSHRVAVQAVQRNIQKANAEGKIKGF